MPAMDYGLIAFGDLEGPERRLAADSVFDGLFARREWYIARNAAVLSMGSRILFYQSGIGFRGTAVVVDVMKSQTTQILGCALYAAFSHRLALGECSVFAHPVSARALIPALDFISNKVHWGQSFRTTPRRISEKDYHTITRQAKERA